MAKAKGTALIGAVKFLRSQMCAIVRAYIAQCLTWAGLGRVALEKRACRAEGDARCAWEVRWSGGGGGDPAC